MIRIPADKWRHFEVGCEIALLAQLLLELFLPHNLLIDISVTMVLVCVIGYGFELYSLVSGNGHYEIMDAVAVFAGGVLGLGVALLLYII